MIRAVAFFAGLTVACVVFMVGVLYVWIALTRRRK